MTTQKLCKKLLNIILNFSVILQDLDRIFFPRSIMVDDDFSNLTINQNYLLKT